MLSKENEKSLAIARLFDILIFLNAVILWSLRGIGYSKPCNSNGFDAFVDYSHSALRTVFNPKDYGNIGIFYDFRSKILILQ